MSASLILLMLFLGYWLKTSYDNAYQTLKTETNYNFFSTINDLEGDVMKNFFSRPLGLKGKDSLSLTFDSESGLTTWKKNGKFSMNGSIKGEDTIISISMPELTKGPKEWMEAEGKTGFLGIKLALENSKSQSDSFKVKRFDKSLAELVKDAYKGDTIKSRFDIQILSTSVDTTYNGQRFLFSDTYTDLVSGERFRAEVPNFQSEIFKRITPQILFSLLLFLMTSLAFFFIYKNLLAQKRLTALKNDFINNLTHELKTPITTVGVAIEAMSNFDALKNPERTKEYLDISKHELNRLSILIDKVLKMSMFEQKQPVLKREPIQVHALTNDIVKSLRLLFDKHGAIITFDAAQEDITIHADKVQIHIQTQVINNTMQMSIRDNGIGIPKGYLNKVFDKFMRVPTGDQHNIKGHGLGLSYVADIVRLHGGKISVESVEGEGSVFKVSLPIGE